MAMNDLPLPSSVRPEEYSEVAVACHFDSKASSSSSSSCCFVLLHFYEGEADSKAEVEESGQIVKIAVIALADFSYLPRVSLPYSVKLNLCLLVLPCFAFAGN